VASSEGQGPGSHRARPYRDHRPHPDQHLGRLKAKGHPVGATGVSQIHELVKQLWGRPRRAAGEGPAVRLAVNFGGFGNNVVATILAKE